MENLGPTQQDASPLGEFVQHVLHRRFTVIGAFGAVFGLALVVAAAIPPTFRASAVLAVLPSPEFTVRAAAGSHDASASALALDQIMKTETEILGSDDLHSATLRAIGPEAVYPDIFSPRPRGPLRRIIHSVLGVLLSPWRSVPSNEAAARDEAGVHRFRSDLSVLPAKDANVITVTFDNRDGGRAAGTINTMLGLYAVRRSRLYDDPQIEVVRQEAAAAGRAVIEADKMLADFKREHQISDYDQERSLLLQRRSQTQQRISDAQTDGGEYQARLTALARTLRSEPATIALYQERDPDTRLESVNAGLHELRAKLAAARDKYKDTSRVVSALRVQITSHEAEAARLTHDPMPSVVRQGRNPSIDPLLLDQARARAEASAAQARLASNGEQAHTMDAALLTLDSNESALAALQRQKAGADQDFREASHILAERHLSEAEDTRRLANVRVIQPATIPQTPRSLPMLVIAAGLVLGAISAFASAVAGFLMTPVVLTGGGLQAATGLPVLAVFHRQPARRREREVVA